jgi:hypothetical protein
MRGITHAGGVPVYASPAAGRNPSALVALDGPDVTDLSSIGVLPELLLGLALAE